MFVQRGMPTTVAMPREDKMQNFNSIIFDVDGVLLDSVRLWYGIAHQVLHDYNKTPERGLEEKVQAMSFDSSAAYLIQHYDLPLNVQELMKYFNDIVLDRYVHAPVKEGVIELLERFTRRGIRMCACSDSSDTLIVPALKKNNLLSYFEFFISSSNLQTNKESPFIYEYCLKKLNADKTMTLVFEDALYAINTLHAAGFRIVGVADPSNIQEAHIMSELCEYYIDLGSLAHFPY